MKASVYTRLPKSKNLLIQDRVESAVPSLAKRVQSGEIDPFRLVIIDPPWGGDHQDWDSPSATALLNQFKTFVPFLPQLFGASGGFVLLFISGEPTPEIRKELRADLGRAVADFSIRRPQSFVQNSSWISPDKDIVIVFAVGCAELNKVSSGLCDYAGLQSDLIDVHGANHGRLWHAVPDSGKSRAYNGTIDVEVQTGVFRRYRPTSDPDNTPGKKICASDFDSLPPLSHKAKREYSGWTTQKSEAFLLTQILMTTMDGDRVLDLYSGSGAAALTAEKLGRGWTAVDNNPKSIELIQRRLAAIGESRAFDNLFYEKPGVGTIIQWEQLRPASVNDPSYSTPFYPREASPFTLLAADGSEDIQAPSNAAHEKEYRQLCIPHCRKHGWAAPPFLVTPGVDWPEAPENLSVEYTFNSKIDGKDYAYALAARKVGRTLLIVSNTDFEQDQILLMDELGIQYEVLSK